MLSHLAVQEHCCPTIRIVRTYNTCTVTGGLVIHNNPMTNGAMKIAFTCTL